MSPCLYFSHHLLYLLIFHTHTSASQPAPYLGILFIFGLGRTQRTPAKQTVMYVVICHTLLSFPLWCYTGPWPLQKVMWPCLWWCVWQRKHEKDIGIKTWTFTLTETVNPNFECNLNMTTNITGVFQKTKHFSCTMNRGVSTRGPTGASAPVKMSLAPPVLTK